MTIFSFFLFLFLLFCCYFVTPMKATRIKEPVHIRRKKMKQGGFSLYLDVYWRGSRSYEFLNMYLIPERSPQDKQRNRQTIQLAEAIKSKRIVELQNNFYGFENEKNRKIKFFDYLKNFEDSYKQKFQLSSYGTFATLKKYLNEYASPKTLLQDIDTDWIKGFKQFLCRGMNVKKLKSNTKWLYFNHFLAIINAAYKDGYFLKNPANGIEKFPKIYNERVYLSIEEVNALINTPCRDIPMRNAFLFSCLTGLRMSDIHNMVWRQVSQIEGFTRVTFRQQKTKILQYLDLSPQAVVFMGERKDDNCLVFNGFRYDHYTSHKLRAWARRAGISKPITFHSARHTFAVMMITLGTDIYTLSKLLGHHSISTTQIYASIIDAKKRDSIMKIPSFGLNNKPK